MKKEIERLQNQYKDILGEHQIVLEMEKSDPYDNRSPRCYRVFARLENGNLICSCGYCQNKERIIKDFEKKLESEINK